MPHNDIIVLDSILRERETRDADTAPDVLFELFTFEQVLKDFDLSNEELEFGRCAGSGDGGIDGFFLFANGELVREALQLDDLGRNPKLELFLIQAKRTAGFSEDIVESFQTTIGDLFDFTTDLNTLRSVYNEQLIEKADVFKDSFINIAARHPTLIVKFFYCSKGDASSTGPSITNKARRLEDRTIQLLSIASSKVVFWGARELLNQSRIEPTYNLTLNFRGNSLSNDLNTYVVLSSLTDYFNFVTDNHQQLRRNIFDANVRDYQGPNLEVNADIARSLSSTTDPDFWWLNNGITILASRVTPAPRSLTLENVQIVNGLQTTQTLYGYLKRKMDEGISDEQDTARSILIKIIISSDLSTWDKITKATNFQTPIPPGSLRATQQLQRDIETYFQQHDLYYDRRKNYYKNLRKSPSKIIGIPFLAQAYTAVILKEPEKSRGRPASVIKKDVDYARVFNSSIPQSVYLLCAQLTRKIESLLREQEAISVEERYNLKYHVAMTAAITYLKTTEYFASELADVTVEQFQDALLTHAIITTTNHARRFIDENQTTLDKISKSRDFTDFLISQLNDQYNI